MGIFNNIGEKDKEDFAGIFNLVFLQLSVRQEQMANYFHKGKS